MNLLVSAYACAPDRGSDHAVGWAWVTEAHRLGHAVWAFASEVHREAILRACAEDPSLAGIKWTFPKIASWPLRAGIEPRWERTYNFLWQRAARQYAAALLRTERIDAIHHASWAGIRAPSFLGGLGPPLILGPIGGGETSPTGLRDQIGRRGRLLEAVRDLSNRTITANPFVRPGLNHAAAIFASTHETEHLFRGSLRRKARVFSQLALQNIPSHEKRPPVQDRPPRFIFAGRLLYWKGVHIALHAFAVIVRSHSGARFTIVGDGPDRVRLEALARALGVLDNVEFVGRVSQARLFELYRSHDLMLFPSLHDSGGFAALEAMARGLPVVCLDLGGPAMLVTGDCGLVVATSGRDTGAVVATMAAGIGQIISDADRLAALSAAARRRAEQFTAGARAQRFYAEVAQIASNWADAGSATRMTDPASPAAVR